MNIDTTADAIWRADIDNGRRDFIAEADVSWTDDIGNEVKQHYRQLARAAVDSLQFTEETRHCQKIELDSHSLSGPLHPAGDMRAESRLVSPWVVES